MAEKTKIAWMKDGEDVGGTLNTLVGCTPASPGCAHCYAVGECWRKAHNTKVARHFEGVVKELPGGQHRWTGRVNFNAEKLDSVLTDRKRRSWFVNSLGDTFHDNVSEETILRHFEVFARAGWQEFRLLTKRAQRVADLNDQIEWPPNVRMGVSVCNATASELRRIVLLGGTNAKHKYISFEPWLSPWPYRHELSIAGAFPMEIDGAHYGTLRELLESAGIEAAIVGGESGKDKASPRYFDPSDAAYLIEEIVAAGATPILKQFGTRWAVATNTYTANRKGGDKTVWPTALRQYSQEWAWLKLPSYAEFTGPLQSQGQELVCESTR